MKINDSFNYSNNQTSALKESLRDSKMMRIDESVLEHRNTQSISQESECAL